MDASQKSVEAGDAVLTFLVETIRNPDTLSIGSFIPVIVQTMIFVEGIKGLGGEGRKDAVIYGVRLYATRHAGEELREPLLTFSEIALPSLIDQLVSVSKTPPEFGRVRFKGCCPN